MFQLSTTKKHYQIQICLNFKKTFVIDIFLIKQINNISFKFVSFFLRGMKKEWTKKTTT